MSSLDLQPFNHLVMSLHNQVEKNSKHSVKALLPILNALKSDTGLLKQYYEQEVHSDLIQYCWKVIDTAEKTALKKIRRKSLHMSATKKMNQSNRFNEYRSLLIDLIVNQNLLKLTHQNEAVYQSCLKRIKELDMVIPVSNLNYNSKDELITELLGAENPLKLDFNGSDFNDKEIFNFAETSIGSISIESIMVPPTMKEKNIMKIRNLGIMIFKKPAETPYIEWNSEEPKVPGPELRRQNTYFAGLNLTISSLVASVLKSKQAKVDFRTLTYTGNEIITFLKGLKGHQLDTIYLNADISHEELLAIYELNKVNNVLITVKQNEELNVPKKLLLDTNALGTQNILNLISVLKGNTLIEELIIMDYPHNHEITMENNPNLKKIHLCGGNGVQLTAVNCPKLDQIHLMRAKEEPIPKVLNCADQVRFQFLAPANDGKSSISKTTIL